MTMKIRIIIKFKDLNENIDYNLALMMKFHYYNKVWEQ